MSRNRSTGARQRGSLDLAGAVTATGGLAVLVFAIAVVGWTSSSTLAAGFGGLALLGVCVYLQARLPSR